MKSMKIVRNSDNQNLLPLECPSCGDVCGSVDEVNGDGAEELKDFIPTRAELLNLYEYWALVSVKTNFERFLSNYSNGSAEMLGPFARQRMDRIEAVLGYEECEVVSHAVERQFADSQGELWEIYAAGNVSARDRLLEANK